MILRPVGGIGNRLRAITSRLEPGLVVQWPIDWECAFGKWEDVFEPIDGVTTINVNRLPNDSFAEPCDLETCDPAPIPIEKYAHNYRRLGVSKRVLALMDRAEKKLGASYTALHIRRTDHRHVIPEGSETYDADFIVFAKQSSDPVFVATDNGETQRGFKMQLDAVSCQDILEGSELAAYGDHTRYTSLDVAVADMFMCRNALRFMGTRGSSFTDTINIMRGLYGRNP